MKKIMIGLLSLGMIAGCAQQPIEPPIEPPVVEEPEEQPEKPSEEETTEPTEDERTSLEKYTIGDIYSKTKETIETTGKLDNEQDYLIKKEVIDYKVEGWESVIEENYSTNETFNWICEWDTSRFQNEHLGINLEGETTAVINDYLNEYFDRPNNRFVKKTLTSKYIIMDDILSVTLKMHTFAGSMYILQQIKVFNFDLKTNKLISNEQLLEKYGYSIEQAQEHANQCLKKEDFRIKKEEYHIINEYFEKEEEIFNINQIGIYGAKTLVSTISNNSVMYIDEQGMLNMLVYLRNSTYRAFDGKIMDYFVIQFD